MHNLYEPLTGLYLNIATAIELLRRTSAPAGVHEALVAATNDGGRIEDQLRVLRDLVSDSRPTLAPVFLPRLLADVASIAYPATVARRCRLSVETPRRLPSVLADERMLRAAFLSLVVDAVSHAAESSRDRRIRICARKHDGASVAVSFFHRRRPEAPPPGGWRIALPRSIAAAHGARLVIEVDESRRIAVHSLWPLASEGRHGRPLPV